MTPYNTDKLLRLASQGKLVMLVPVVMGENMVEADFVSGEAYENIDDQTITLITASGKWFVFASKSLLGTG